MDNPTASHTGAKLRAWAVILFIAGVWLNHYPFLALFNQPVTFFGVPLLILYLHLLWIGVIVGLFLLARAFRRTLASGSEAEES